MVLIVEDDDLVRDLLSDLLRMRGFGTAVASNGAQGFELARTLTPSLVITDVAMPGMDGFELLTRLRGTGKLRTVPVIMISAQADRSAIRQGMDLGADDYITKPFTQEEVVRSVSARLEKKELLDELDAFCHTVAHDLRNPLQNLTAQLDLMSLMWDQGDIEVARGDLSQAIVSAWRLNAVIDELLVFAGVRQHKVVSEPLDMEGIVDEAIQRVGDQLRKTSARVVKPQNWPVAVGHAAWVVHIWTNYLSNAAKHGGRAPVISVGGELLPGDRTIRFWVQDHGPGLDGEALSRVSLPLTRVSSAAVDGHGLGLSIVRRIAAKLGGRSGVESQPGEGARFWFELPACPVGEIQAVAAPDPGI